MTHSARTVASVHECATWRDTPNPDRSIASAACLDLRTLVELEHQELAKPTGVVVAKRFGAPEGLGERRGAMNSSGQRLAGIRDETEVLQDKRCRLRLSCPTFATNYNCLIAAIANHSPVRIGSNCKYVGLLMLKGHALLVFLELLCRVY